MAPRQNLRPPIRCVQAGSHVRPLFISSTVPTTHLYSEQETVFAALANPPSPATVAALTSTIARRLTPQPIKLRADIELTCYTPAGIDAIKKALRAGEKESNETVPIKAKLVAPPLYVLSTNATDKVRGRAWARMGADDTLSMWWLVCCDRPFGTRHRIDTGFDRNSRRGVGCQDEGKFAMCSGTGADAVGSRKRCRRRKNRIWRS